eukprot:3213901-Rhodomonas_salina.1
MPAAPDMPRTCSLSLSPSPSLPPSLQSTGRAAHSYVVFHSEVLASPAHSPLVRSSTHPVWVTAPHELTLSLAAPTLAHLEWEFVVLSVMQRTRAAAPDVSLGVGVILLSALTPHVACEVDVIVPLLAAGVSEGRVLCTLQVRPVLARERGASGGVVMCVACLRHA